jgi:tetratricopeptide (TPR) repeat protein
MTMQKRRRVVVDDRPLASAIGGRLREARKRAGLTQQQLAGERYTKAYVSALETGLAKPSMAALNYLSARLGLAPSELLTDRDARWTRLEADVQLASGSWETALGAYESLLVEDRSRTDRAHVLAGIAEALVRLDRAVEAIRPAAEAADIFERGGRAADLARAQYWMSAGHNATDNTDEARSILRHLLDEVRAGLLVDPDFATRLLVALAGVETHAGEHHAALAYLEEARNLTSDMDIRRRATFLFDLAMAYRRTGDHEGAIRAGTQSLSLFQAAEAFIEAAGAANDLALAYLATGNRDRAHTMAAMAREISEREHDDRRLAFFAETEARIALDEGDARKADRLATEAIDLAEKTHNRKALLDGLITKARALVAEQRPDEAVGIYARAAEIARDSAPPSRVRKVLSAWADTLASMGRHDEAYALAREALSAGSR